MLKVVETYMIELLSDKLLIRGPRVDGTFTISFEIGEYERNKVAELVNLDPGVALKLTIEEDTT